MEKAGSAVVPKSIQGLKPSTAYQDVVFPMRDIHATLIVKARKDKSIPIRHPGNE
jgi:hypothetical protein